MVRKWLRKSALVMTETGSVSELTFVRTTWVEYIDDSFSGLKMRFVSSW